jgi:cell wall-associated NlpC family hydrolase
MPTSPRSRVPLFVLLVSLVAAGVHPGTAAPNDGKEAIPVLTSERTPEARAPTTAERAVSFAVEAVGVPYRWGGESPSTGFDCSGLVRWAYGRVGIDLPHNSYALYDEGRRVREAGMEPGDILFFEGLGHVGLYLGRGRMVHAPQTGRNVEVVRLASTNYGARLIGARRVAVA